MGLVGRNHTQITEGKAEPEEGRDDRLGIASLPDSGLTETDLNQWNRYLFQEPIPQRDQEATSTLRRLLRQRMSSLEIQGLSYGQKRTN